jgi:hypothetical protein
VPKPQLIRPIVLYRVEHHPLEIPDGGAGFRWIGDDPELWHDLQDLIGPVDRDDVSLLVDAEPAGENWERLLEAVLANRVKMVITHLAPLSSAQRQQLIGVCAQSGVQLITPSDAGRNREGETLLPE